MTTSNQRCQHRGCECPADLVTAVQRDGATYCSERCADNRGCDHKGCNCGVFPTDEAVAR